jgi:protein-tyrosine phosphatase
VIAAHPLSDTTPVDHDRTSVPVGPKVRVGSASRHPDRLIPLDGALNFRDVGGYSVSGGSVAWRVLFRSDNLAALSDADLATIGRLGLRLVCDFRRDDEVEEKPSRLPVPGPDVLRLAMSDTVEADRTMVDTVQAILRGERPPPPLDFWDEQYVGALERGQARFVRWVRAIVTTHGPTLFHCAGGKDRTGLAAMLLLTMLGASDDDVLDDFELTNALRTPTRIAFLRPRLAAVGVVAEELAHVIGVRRESMAHAMAYVRASHGGAERYLLGGGLEAEVVDQVRACLVR